MERNEEAVSEELIAPPLSEEHLRRIAERLDKREITSDDLVSLLVLEVKKLKEQTHGMCSVCTGTGKPLSDKKCVCGGTGTAESEAARLRELLVHEQQDNENLRRAAQVGEGSPTDLASRVKQLAYDLMRERAARSAVEKELKEIVQAFAIVLGNFSSFANFSEIESAKQVAFKQAPTLPDRLRAQGHEALIKLLRNEQ